MRTLARILLLFLIIGFSIRLIAMSIAVAGAIQHANNFSYAMGRFAASALLLAFVIAAFRRLAPRGSTPPPLSGSLR